MTVAKVALEFRDYTDADSDLVYGAWMRGARKALRFSQMIPDCVYYSSSGQRGKIARTLADPTTRCRIGERSGAVVGFCVTGQGGSWEPAMAEMLHWVHIKPEFRGMGLLRQFLEDSRVVRVGTLTVTHATKGIGAIQGWCRHIQYNPFL